MIKRSSNLESGQGFILMVMAVALVATSIALYTLDRSQNSFKESVNYRRKLDSMYVLEGVARWLHSVYYFESNCDPYIFNNKINGVRLPDLPGSRVYVSQFKRNNLDNAVVLSVQVSIGELNPPPEIVQDIGAPLGTAAAPAVPPLPYAAPGGAFGPQDVSVTYWFSLGAGSPQGGTRYEQTITLINNCSLTAGVAPNPAIPAGTAVYGTINNVAAYAAVGAGNNQVAGTVPANATCIAGRPLGSIDGAAGTALVDSTDKELYANWLKNGDTTTVIPAATAGLCLDMNTDGVMDEVDMNILDKVLKGYFFFTAASTQR